MPETKVFGRREDTVDVVDYSPIPIAIAGYDAEGNEHVFEFLARGTLPMGSMMEALSQIAATERLQAAHFFKLVMASLEDDEQRRKWSDTLDRKDLTFTMEMFAQMFDELHVRWTGVPFRSRSVRRAGQARRAMRSTSAAKSLGRG